MTSHDDADPFEGMTTVSYLGDNLSIELPAGLYLIGDAARMGPTDRLHATCKDNNASQFYVRDGQIIGLLLRQNPPPSALEGILRVSCEPPLTYRGLIYPPSGISIIPLPLDIAVDLIPGPELEYEEGFVCRFTQPLHVIHTRVETTFSGEETDGEILTIPAGITTIESPRDHERLTLTPRQVTEPIITKEPPRRVPHVTPPDSPF